MLEKIKCVIRNMEPLAVFGQIIVVSAFVKKAMKHEIVKHQSIAKLKIKLRMESLVIMVEVLVDN